MTTLNAATPRDSLKSHSLKSRDLKSRNLRTATFAGAVLGLLGLQCSATSPSQSSDVPSYSGNLLPGGSAANGSGVVGTTNGTNGNPNVPGGSSPSGTNEGSPNVSSVSGNGTTPGGSGATAPGTTADGTTPPADGTTPPAGAGLAAHDLTCGNISIPAADVISDFSTPTPIMYQQADRGGTTWLSYSATPDSDPIAAGNAFAIDPTQSGPCNSGGALHVSSKGNTGYGVGLGINFKPDAAANARDLYNAQADGFTGVGFFAQCKQEVTGVFLKFSDDATENQVVTPQCSFDGKAPLTRLCRQYGVKNAVLFSNGWTHYQVYFADALLDTDATFAGTGLHTNALTAFQIQINSQSATQANPFDCLIDDVHFLHDPAPVTPPPAAVTTVAGHTIAPGGYYTQGNQIFDSSGNVHIFKGLDRPSMEFDPAGQGITRDDVERMKAVGANVIRWSLDEGYWLSTKADFNANYQAYVDRAVNWTLQNGMDVILDLHWLHANTNPQDQMADRAALTFWQQVAAKYKGDGRVLFELYNEPYNISNTAWLMGDGTNAGMQEMYTAVRNAGANNLVLVGGLDFANDLDGPVGANPVTGTNIVYVTHPYIWKSPPKGYANTAAKFPVIATEFGDAAANPAGRGPDSCDANPYSSTIADFTTRGISWTSWAWFASAQRCAFPALIEKFDGTPTAPGAAVFAALKQ